MSLLAGCSTRTRGTLTRAVLVAILVATLAAPPVAFADTVTGTANGNNPRVFTFTADASGQVLVTLTWNRRPRDLVVVVIDTDRDPLTWCGSIARQDRVQRCEFGAVAGLEYAIGVQTTGGRSKFQLNVQSSGSERVLGPGVGGGLRELDDSAPGAAAVRRAMDRAIGRLAR